jgi:membrane protein YqaA with SNARE-associated domain
VRALPETLVSRPRAWAERFAASPLAIPILFLVSLVEAALAPLPPDILLIAMAVGRPRSSLFFALVCAAGSTTGAILGYALGASVFEAVGGTAIHWLGLDGSFHWVLSRYHEHPFAALLASGFTNIPFFVFSIAAGYMHTVALGTFMIGASAGRLLRFLLVGGILFYFGPAMGRLLERYLLLVSLIVLVLFLVMIWFLKA